MMGGERPACTHGARAQILHPVESISCAKSTRLPRGANNVGEGRHVRSHAAGLTGTFVRRSDRIFTPHVFLY